MKILLKTALVTAGAVVIYQVANLLLVYHYFSYEYGMVATAIIALCIGIVLARKYVLEQRKSTIMGAEVEKIHDPLDGLTAKELQILTLIYQGKTNKEIAVKNFVELSTVKTHVNNLYAKLGVNNRKAATKIYALHTDILNSTFSPPPENV